MKAFSIIIGNVRYTKMRGAVVFANNPDDARRKYSEVLATHGLPPDNGVGVYEMNPEMVYLHSGGFTSFSPDLKTGIFGTEN